MLNFWFDAARLTLEAHQVVVLRTMKIAAGGSGARKEARLMVTEKVAAALHEGGRLMLGGRVGSVKRVRKKVSANARRLRKSFARRRWA